MPRFIHYMTIASTALVMAGCSTLGGGPKTAEQTQSLAQKQVALATAAQDVLKQQMAKSDDKRIPRQLVANARCVGVFPSVSQAGLIVGVKTGEGLITCRQKEGGFASAEPAVFTLSGGSVGLQAGAQRSSIVMLFNTETSVESLFTPEFKFGSQIQASAGPSGYDRAIAGAPAPVVAYMTSVEGLFAGINLNGDKVSVDSAANAAVYGPDATARGILLGQTHESSAMDSYISTLQEYAPGGGGASNSGGGNQSNNMSGSQSNSGQPANPPANPGQQQQQPQPQNPPQSGSGQQQQSSGSGSSK